MLSLKNIVKDYVTGDTKVRALKGVSVDFRDNEFVSILGASGCGKTTLLNIVGGLDRYTSGDLIINGVSTKEYTDADWDGYRNHTIGFVFQSYNLIMHQTVLGNVELALTLSGVSAKERKEIATRALEKVGLEEHLNKRPNQLSGGQMQRVAIARAIVNNPDIILADEPTGALDTQTSVQIMDILKEIAKDKLVVMVTHNPELAEKYSTRIVRLSDGELLSDSNPVSKEEYSVLLQDAIGRLEEENEEEGAEIAEDLESEKIKKSRKTRKNSKKHPSMSFFTALSLSLKNLLTKKARTILVSFAGSIGIIGIALILSLSSGFQLYINKVQEDTLSNYPLTIQKETMDMTAMASAMLGVVSGEDKQKEPENVYANNMMYKMLSSMLQQRVKNNLTDFNKKLTSDEELKQAISAIQYTYDFDLQIFYQGSEPLNAAKETIQVNPSKMMDSIFGTYSSMAGSMVGMSVSTWAEMLDNQTLLQSQYDLLGGGRWPKAYNEVVIVVDGNEEINDYILYSLGILDQKELNEMMKKLQQGEKVEPVEHKYSYADLLGLKYKLVPNSELYNYNQITGIASEKTADEKTAAIANGLDIEVVGIIKPKVSAAATSVTGTIGYTSELTKKVAELNAQSYAVKAQLRDPETDIFTGKKFESGYSSEYTLDDIKKYIISMSMGMFDEERAQSIIDTQIKTYMDSGLTREEAEAKLISQFKEQMEEEEVSSYEGNLEKLGFIEVDKPKSISIYAADFESKDKIVAWIDEYNNSVRQTEPDNVISYTDYVGLMMASISTIINAISYVLIGFVAISLVVSSIMIGVITYISVLERTKEIGVLRSIGASKRDISRVFNAETFIVGLAAGIFGVLIAMLIDIPINIVLAVLANLHGIAAVPWWGGLALVIISVVLTLIAGIVPSRIAAKKDPVVALRTE